MFHTITHTHTHTHTRARARARAQTHTTKSYYIQRTLKVFTYKDSKGEYTLVTLPRVVTPYRDSVDETRVRVTY
jgi:hypothetical protein